MATLSSSSSLAEIQAAYDDNASYDEDGSAAKAKTFITACRLLLRQTATGATSGSANIQMDVGLIRDELQRARRWLTTNDPAAKAGQVIHPSFDNFRD